MSRKQQPFWRAKANPSLPQPAAPDNRIKIMIAVFTGAERNGWVHPRLLTTIMRLAYDQRFLVSLVPIHAVHPVCAARNMAVRDFFLKHDSEILILFDNDVAPPDNIGDAIASMPKECNIAVMPYWVWLPDAKHTMPCFGFWSDGVMIIPDPTTLKPGWQEMGAGGTGCMFVRRKVFTSPDKLQAPFFKIISTADKGQVVSEDVYFTGRACDAGFPTWVNTDYICSHYHTVDLADLNLGTVLILKRFTDVIKKKYGDAGIELKTLIQELHPELQEAAKAVHESVEQAYAENNFGEQGPEDFKIARDGMKGAK
jgi:hypothetical protein